MEECLVEEEDENQGINLEETEDVHEDNLVYVVEYNY